MVASTRAAVDAYSTRSRGGLEPRAGPCGEPDPRYHGTSPVPVEVRAMQARALLIRRPSKSRRRAPLLVPIVAALMLGVAGPVQATITPSSTALTIAQAIASSSLTVTAASFVAVPPSGTPNGVSTSVLGGFPVDGADYGILTSRMGDGVGSNRERSQTPTTAVEMSGATQPGRLDPEGRRDRARRGELSDVQFQVPLGGIPGLRRLKLQRRIHSTSLIPPIGRHRARRSPRRTTSRSTRPMTSSASTRPAWAG